MCLTDAQLLACASLAWAQMISRDEGWKKSVLRGRTISCRLEVYLLSDKNYELRNLNTQFLGSIPPAYFKNPALISPSPLQLSRWCTQPP